MIPTIVVGRCDYHLPLERSDMTSDQSGETAQRRTKRGRTIAGIAVAVVTAFAVAIASGAGEAVWDKVSSALGFDRRGPAEPTPTQDGGQLPTAAPTSQAPPIQPITAHVFNVMFRGDSLIQSLRAELPATDRTITVRATGLGSPSAGGDLQACPAGRGGGPIVAEKCQQLVAGRDVNFTELDAVQVRPAAKVPGDAVRIVAELAFTYRPAQRSFRLALPDLRQGEGASLCKDNGCNPFVEITPFLSGRFNASATWNSNGDAHLILEIGGVAAHAAVAFGQPYQIVGEAKSNGGHSVETGGLVYGKEFAVAVIATNLLGELVLDLSWEPS
jgi:hypothetical protein